MGVPQLKKSSMTNDDYHGKLGRRVRYMTHGFWVEHASILQRHGLSHEDLMQQGWVEFLRLEREWPTNPTKYLRSRLIDWMRHSTKWTKSTRTPAPFMENFEYKEDMMSPPRGCNATSWEPSEDPPKYEDKDLLGKLLQSSQRHGERVGNMMRLYADGATMKSIGVQHAVSEGRVSQILNREFRYFRERVLMLAIMGLCFLTGGIDPLPVNAQATSQEIEECNTLSWQANTEEDLAGYEVHVEKDGVPLEKTILPKDKISITCSALEIVAGAEYQIIVKAFDTSGNVSDPSEPLALVWPDVHAPGVPMNVCLDVLINGQTKKLCLTIGP